MKKNKQNILFISASVFLAFLLFFSGTQIRLQNKYQALYEIDESTKTIGEIKTKKIKIKDTITIRHYPKTTFKDLNQMIESKQEESLNPLAKETKQDYKINMIHDRYLIVTLFNVEDGLESKHERIQFDLETEEEVQPKTLFNPQAMRYLEYLNVLNSPIILHESEIELGSHLITQEKLASHLKIKYGTITPGDPSLVPSVYLEHTADPSQKTVAITFDDGPHQTNTQRIIEISKSYDAQVTFFVLGLNIDRYPHLVKLILDEGHQLASHTFGHKNFNDISNEDVNFQINHTNELLNEKTGNRQEWVIRPPYGAYNQQILDQFPHVYVNWSVDTQDWLHKDAQMVCDAMVDAAFDGAIILLHDIYDTSVDGFECGIKRLHEQGYQMLTINDMFKAKGIELKPGHVYRSAVQ